MNERRLHWVKKKKKKKKISITIDDIRRKADIRYTTKKFYLNQELNDINSKKNATVHYGKEIVELFEENLDCNDYSCLTWVKNLFMKQLP